MLILNPDLPLHETYPFSAQVPAALEPHILKETAFSDAEIPGPYSQERQGGATTKSHRDPGYSSGEYRQEPSVHNAATNGARSDGEEAYDEEST